MKKEENLGGVSVVLCEGEKVEIIVADVKILKFRKTFRKASKQSARTRFLLRYC